MTETDGRLAPVSYLFGAPPSVPSASAAAPAPEPHAASEPAWNDAWGAEPGDSCARLIDAEEGDARFTELLDVERISLRALGRRSISRRELERTLRDAGVDDDAIANECERLTRVGLLDDTALAQTLVARLQERKGLGRTAIAAELARRMLAPSAIEYALELIDTADELARARELARSRAAQLRDLDRDTAVRRLSGYLARRGYSGSTVRAAVDDALPVDRRGSTVRFR